MCFDFGNQVLVLTAVGFWNGEENYMRLLGEAWAEIGGFSISLSPNIMNLEVSRRSEEFLIHSCKINKNIGMEQEVDRCWGIPYFKKFLGFLS